MRLLDLKTLDYTGWRELEKKLGRNLDGSELVAELFVELINLNTPSGLNICHKCDQVIHKNWCPDGGGIP